MTKPINTDSIEAATGKSWDEWVAYLDGLDAPHMPHHEIAAAIIKDGIPGWWAQNITVAYEQHIGRRKPGQRKDGTFEVSVSKTLPGSPDDAMEYWTHKTADMDSFDGVALAEQPRVSTTEKWRHWRVNLHDGGKVTVSTTRKNDESSLLTVTSQKLHSDKDTEKWRTYWKAFINQQ